MAERDYVVRYPTLRQAVQGVVLALTLPVVPLAIVLAVTGAWAALVGALVYCWGVAGIAGWAEARKDRGARGQVKFRVDEVGVYFGETRTTVPWRRVGSVILRRDSGGAGPAVTDVVVVFDDDSYQTYLYANRVEVKAAIRRFAPRVPLTDQVVTDPPPAVKQRKQDR